MIDITKAEIDLAIPKVKEGLEKYYLIQKKFNNINIQKDFVFQRKFNGFYRVRRNAEWRKSFYDIFENSKNTACADFKIVLEQIYKKTNMVEASFASKLIATINLDLPVLDKFILDNTNLKLPYTGAKNRLNKIVKIYNELIKKFDSFKKTENGKYLVLKFKKEFPSYKITETKMIDLVLWQTR